MIRQTDMSVTSSSSSIISLLPPHHSSSNSSLQFSLYHCFRDKTAILIFTASYITKLLLLPLFILVICVGHQRWRKQCSVVTSNSDFFTYNMVVMELITVMGSSFFCCGTYTGVQSLMMVGTYIFSFISPGQTLFNLLTCVERYLAVVHPFTYLSLRHVGGVRIRNISTGCVWLMCFAGMGVTEEIVRNFSSVSATSFWVISLICIFFLSISVVCVLIHPRPGDGARNRERNDQSKQAAVYTIMATMGVLLLSFVGYLACTLTYTSSELSRNEKCVVIMSVVWFCLPSSLVLPLLFLHRAGKLPGCKRNTASG